LRKNLQEKGLRVIAVATKKYSSEKKLEEKLENAKLEFVEIVGLIDPPRESVKENIRLCKKAGVRVVMITTLIQFCFYFLMQNTRKTSPKI
jgi:Ca2+-transporting ATPase